MNIRDIISPAIPVLLPHDTGDRALALMEENHVTELPLADAEGKYLGLVKEDDMLNLDDPGMVLKESAITGFKPAIPADSHPYDAVRVLYAQNLCLLPVVDKDDNYLGVVTQSGLLKFLAEHSGIDNPGGIIILEIDPRNYSLPDIARICESEEVMIINSNLFTNKDTNQFEVTIKINRTSVDAVVTAFERYGYKVKEAYGEQISKEYIVDRYNMLMNYLNM